jgi:hypothetical protein
MSKLRAGLEVLIWIPHYWRRTSASGDLLVRYSISSMTRKDGVGTSCSEIGRMRVEQTKTGCGITQKPGKTDHDQPVRLGLLIAEQSKILLFRSRLNWRIQSLKTRLGLETKATCQLDGTAQNIVRGSKQLSTTTRHGDEEVALDMSRPCTFS